ncbi:MAG: LPP20 family lipoprotein [Nitrospinae bacterium]|nr:LPP20 family lipoprotein [Nitrospinota bacterium]
MATHRTLIAAFVSAILISAGIAGADCGFLEDRPQPKWVAEVPVLEGFYVGVGSAGKGNSQQEQENASLLNALSYITSQVSVKINSKSSDVSSSTSKGSSEQTSQSVESKVELKSEELLKDVTIIEKWLNGNSCQLYTLVKVPKDSVTANKNYKKMTFLYAQSQKSGLQANESLGYLTEAKALLPEIKFAFIHEQNDPKYWAELIDKAIERCQAEVGKKKNVIMLVMKKNPKPEEAVTIPLTVVQKLAAYIAGLNPVWTDMSNSPCVSVESCLEKARKTGVEGVLVLICSGGSKQSNLGSFKGTLTVEISQYDLKLNTKAGTPQLFSSAVPSPFSKEELDWNLAVEKLINSKKLDYLKD